MSDNAIRMHAAHYTDVQGLAALKGQIKTAPQAAAKEVAQQFESLMVQMMLKSMRNASQVFNTEDQHNEAFALYQDLFDKQISMSVSGFGIGKQIEAYLQTITPSAAQDMAQTPEKPVVHQRLTRVSEPVKPMVQEMKTEIASTEKPFSDPRDFIQRLSGYAKSAAQLLHVDPKILLAQAALETGWGKKIIACAKNGSTMNLFNIKADKSWDKAAVQHHTLEERDGLMQKESAAFRAYTSYEDSFKDYVTFIQNNPRYMDALRHSGDPERYVQALQDAEYATDSHYKEKIMQIYHSPHFRVENI